MRGLSFPAYCYVSCSSFCGKFVSPCPLDFELGHGRALTKEWEWTRYVPCLSRSFKKHLEFLPAETFPSAVRTVCLRDLWVIFQPGFWNGKTQERGFNTSHLVATNLYWKQKQKVNIHCLRHWDIGAVCFHSRSDCYKEKMWKADMTMTAVSSQSFQKRDNSREAKNRTAAFIDEVFILHRRKVALLLRLETTPWTETTRSA